MTVNEFERYFKLGHGKAIILLRDEPDKKQFQKAFLENICEHCLWDYGVLEYVERIMFILIDDEFRLKMKSAFMDSILSYENMETYKLLDCLGYSNEAYQCFTTVYEESYKLTKNALESGNYKNDNFRAGYINYKISCGCLGKYCENDIPKLLKDNADLYLIADDLARSPIFGIYHEFQNQGRGEYFKELFDAVLKDHQAYEKIKASVFLAIKEWESKEYKTLEDFRNFNKDIYEYGDYADLKYSLLKASDELYSQVAQMALDETDLNKKELFFEIFKKEKEEYGATHQFPLSPEPLIEMAREFLDNYSVKKDETTAVNYLALQILSEMKNTMAKEFCLWVFNNSEADISVKREVIHTLEENYTPDDEKLIRDIYPEFKHNVVKILHELSEKGIKDAPYDLLFDAYQNTRYLYKCLTVQALINTGLITDEMLNECTYDENSEVIKASKKEINKRIMEKRNNKDNNGWNEIKSQEDIDFLLRRTCAFHDAGLVSFEYNPKEAKESPTYMPFPLMLRFDLFFYDDAYSSLMGLEMLCEEVEHFNFYVGVDIIAMFFAATFKFYEKSILWGADPGPAQEKNKYGFADDEVWIKCKRIKWRLRESFQEKDK